MRQSCGRAAGDVLGAFTVPLTYRAAKPATGRRRGLQARRDEVARDPRGLHDLVAGILEHRAVFQRLPDATVLLREPDVREAVRVGVAGAGVAVPVLGERLRIPVAVAARKMDRPRHGLSVHPDAPPRVAAAHLEHREVVLLTWLHLGLDLVVYRRLARNRH